MDLFAILFPFTDRRQAMLKVLWSVLEWSPTSSKEIAVACGIDLSVVRSCPMQINDVCKTAIVPVERELPYSFLSSKTVQCYATVHTLIPSFSERRLKHLSHEYDV